MAGDYATADGWVSSTPTPPTIGPPPWRCSARTGGPGGGGRRRGPWAPEELESAVVAAGGAAAALRSREWDGPSPGRAVCRRAAGGREHTDDCPGCPDGPAPADRPVHSTGVRVLDLTRVLAGPVATRLLAGWGAEVLRIDPPGWDEPAWCPR